MYFIISYFILSFWHHDWMRWGIDELQIRTDSKFPLFVGTTPIERKELHKFLNLSSSTDAYGKWLKERITQNLRNMERWEWNVGAIEDSFSQQFVLLGKGIRRNFVSLFVKPVAKFGDSCWYPSKKWQKIIASDYLKGYIKVSIFNLCISFGREPIKWGPSPRNSLVLSNNYWPFDLLRASYTTRRFKFSSFGTILDSKNQINRYFSGHRIEYNFNNMLNLGFSEVALFGGKGKPPELYYFNPIFLYYPYQWNRNSMVNILWGLDFNLLLKGIGIYTEFMIDDMPWKQTERGEHHKIGLNCGLKGVISRIYWLAEYTTVTRWTYGHDILWQQYTYLGYSIGHPIGADFDELFLGIVYHLTKTVDLIINTSLLRKGEGNISDPYPDYFPKEYWLTGKLKKTKSVEFGIKWYKVRKFVFTFKGGYFIEDKEIFPKFSFLIGNWG